jgi:hypothetical protein
MSQGRVEIMQSRPWLRGLSIFAKTTKALASAALILTLGGFAVD